MLNQCIESSLKLEIVKNKRKRVETYSGGKLWKDYFFFFFFNTKVPSWTEQRCCPSLWPSKGHFQRRWLL